jgi:hypothetical protein
MNREVKCDSVDYIDLARNRVKWRAFLEIVMNLPAPSRQWNS